LDCHPAQTPQLGQQFFGQEAACQEDDVIMHAVVKMTRPFLLKGLLHCNDCGSTMTPHYVQKRRKDGSVNRIPHYRCTRTMKYDNRVCRIKHLNADQTETTVIESLYSLNQNEESINATIHGLNHDLKAKVAPLEKEITQITSRLGELEPEIDNFVQALGKGKISVDRLEREMAKRETDQKVLRERLDTLNLKMNDEAANDFNSEIVLKNLREFRSVFDAMKSEEKSETLQCLLKKITAEPGKLVLDVYELADFQSSPANHSEWRPYRESNPGYLREREVS
jgi:hypothetical protein